jgi:hypothetical protein
MSNFQHQCVLTQRLLTEGSIYSSIIYGGKLSLTDQTLAKPKPDHVSRFSTQQQQSDAVKFYIKNPHLERKTTS